MATKKRKASSLFDNSITKQGSFIPGTATKGSVQQRVHRMSVGHDERLVVGGRYFLGKVRMS